MSFLGIDTSNYTTSLALVRGGEAAVNLKKGVYVGEQERGVRQSDALFSHVKNLPALFEALGRIDDLEAVGYSARPRDVEGSYMPCFLAGELAARALAANRGLPLYAFSHQAGHLRAALYSAGADHLLGKEFLAFHVSGGTTELLRVCGGEPGRLGRIEKIGGTLDLNAGQCVDRAGVLMGLRFPCGPELEKLARGVKPPKALTSVKGLTCNLSGLENRVKKMLEEGRSREETAAFTIESVRSTLQKLTENALAAYGKLPVLYAGGVMSCAIIREDFQTRFGGYFADPAFSADNAAGTALLTRDAAQGEKKT